MNIIACDFRDDKLIFDSRYIELSDRLMDDLKDYKKDKIYLGIRPEYIDLSIKSEENSIPIKVKYTENLGSTNAFYFELADKEFSFIKL